MLQEDELPSPTTAGYLQTGDAVSDSDSDSDSDEPDLAVVAKAVPGSRNAVPDRVVTEPFALSSRVRQNSVSGVSGVSGTGARDNDSSASFVDNWQRTN